MPPRPGAVSASGTATGTGFGPGAGSGSVQTDPLPRCRAGGSCVRSRRSASRRFRVVAEPRRAHSSEVLMAGAIQMRTDIPGPRSAAVLARKAKVVCDPLDIHVPTVIDSALGARFTDIDGNHLLDFSAGLGCQLVGYSHPKVVEAVQRQAARVSHTDFSVIPYESYVRLAEGLVARAGIPGAKVALFNSGAEAIENAVK